MPEKWHGRAIEAMFAILLLAATVSTTTAQSLGGVVQFHDRCWPYSSTANRISLLTRQSVNQKAVFRTSSSLWCTDTAQLSGTVLSIINGTSFAPDASGLVVQVQWNNGIVGFHRMGAFGEWDLDTPSMTSTQLSRQSTAAVSIELRSTPAVWPTNVSWPSTDWLILCNVGLTLTSGSVGELVHYNSQYGVAVVQWVSRLGGRNFPITGLYRYNSNAYEVCFSGCSDFSRYSVLQMGAFSFCRRVVPSPSLLQSVVGSEASVGERFIILPPYYVGIKLTTGSPRCPMYVDDPRYVNITFVDVALESLCITSASLCPDWSDLKMNDLVSLITIGLGVNGSGSNSPWVGSVTFSPGRVITQATSGAPYVVNNMGASNSYDFCLGVPTFPNCTDNVTNSTAAPATVTDCTFDILRYFYLVVVPFSVVCLLYITFRKPDHPFQLTTKPTIPVPVNLLYFRIDRGLVAVTYVATFQVVFLLILGGLDLGITTNSASGARFVAFAARILLAIVIGFSFYAIFMGITTLHQPEGVIIGFLFCVLFVVFYIMRIVSCRVSSKVVLSFQAMPSFICLLVLGVYFVKRIIRYMPAAARQGKMATVVTKYEVGRSITRELSYLRSLLKRNLIPVIAEQERLKAEARKGYIRALVPRVWEWLHYNFPIPSRSDTFSFSPLYLSSVVLGVTGVYMVVVQFLPPVVVLLISLDDGANNRTALDANRAVDIASVLFFSNKAAAVDFVIKLNNLLAASLLISVVAALIAICFHALHMVQTYKRHMLRLYRGDWSFMPPNIPTPLSQAKHFGKFLGTQTAFIMYGFTIILLALLLVIIVIGGFIICLEYFAWARNFLLNFALPTLAILIIVYIMMSLLAVVAIDKKESIKFAVLKRPVFYHNVVYLLVYYNVFLGIVSVLFRMLYIAAFNVTMLLRLNRPLMPRGWEKWDFGYYSYCGFLSMEFSYTHPCMLAFTTLLKEQTQQPARSSRAARRWHLLYTLVRNPDLVRLRKRNLTSDMPCLTNHGLLMNMRVSSSVNGDMSLLTATSSLSVTSSQKLIEQEDYGHGLNSGYKLYEDSAKA